MPILNQFAAYAKVSDVFWAAIRNEIKLSKHFIAHSMGVCMVCVVCVCCQRHVCAFLSLKYIY